MRDITLNREHLEELGNQFEVEIAGYIKAKYPSFIIMHNISLFCKQLDKDTQIDLICISAKNIYVLEAKNWTGYIKGEYNDYTWNGKSRARIEMSVFNPVNQNDLHIRTLRNALRLTGFNPPKFINLVVVPDGTTIMSACSEVINVSKLSQTIDTMEKTSNLSINTARMSELLKEVCVK